MVEVLIKFLEYLEEPIIPQAFYKSCIDSVSESTSCLETISKIPNENLICFHYIMSFLREIVKKNFVSADELGIIFSRVIFRFETDDQNPKNEEIWEQRAKIQFIKFFLRNDITYSKVDVGLEDENETLNKETLNKETLNNTIKVNENVIKGS
jgi:hypothetical protein